MKKRLQVLIMYCFLAMLMACSQNKEKTDSTENNTAGGDTIDSDTQNINDTNIQGTDNETPSPTDTDSTTINDDTQTQTDTNADTLPLLAACEAPVSLDDDSTPDAVVGNGTPDSCTEDALREAISQRGLITFNCGDEPVTILLTEQLDVSGNTDLVIDGGGLITLDGGNSVRHFYYHAGWWMEGTVKLVLWRLSLINGQAPLGDYTPQDPDNSDCAYGYTEGSGGSVYIRDGVLHIIDSVFLDNQAALEGPDVGGGAIYALGSSEVIISGSLFKRNRAANGGAVGMLFANPKIYNTVFEDNTAQGIGMNYVEPGCPGLGHDDQGGAGGLGGAVYFDGMNDDDTVYTICGCTFKNNRANELGGALFRTPNVQIKNMLIDKTSFEENTARMGAVSFIKDNVVTVSNSLFALNKAGIDIDGNEISGPFGGLWVNEGSVNITNSTFYQNTPSGLNVEGSASTIKNSTFVENPIAGNFTVNNCLFYNVNCSSEFSGSFNLQWPQANSCVENITFTDPQLGTLSDNGGFTQSAMPQASKQVMGIGQDCPETDQLGTPRPEANCTVGAVEIP